ncbi:methyltransferase domain-containing protein [bacterium]|nr:MAG: methyltransferase domain-containing protein [bacterium]
MSNNTNDIYSKKMNIWGIKPTPLYQVIIPKLSLGSFFLDLGCGQGRDSIFMASNNFKVISVDESLAAINQLDAFARKNNLDITCLNIKTENFLFEKNKYDIIGAVNVLHFLHKKDGLRIIQEIKENLKIGGYVVMVNFTTKDSLFSCRPNLFFLEPNELKNFFGDFKLILYDESIENDIGHPGQENPHKHGLVRMIAKKIHTFI